MRDDLCVQPCMVVEHGEAPADARCGEAPVAYLASRRASGRIRGPIPDAGLIVMPREPVERLMSHHRHANAGLSEPIGRDVAAIWYGRGPTSTAVAPAPAAVR